MPQVLLYNITDPEKLVKIKLALYRLGAACREVTPAEYTHPLGYLLGLEGYAPAEDVPTDGFTAEMLLMDGLRGPLLDRFLDELCRMRATVPLKAVVTEHNVAWSSLRLYRELEQERLAMSRLKGASPARKSTHKKKR